MLEGLVWIMICVVCVSVGALGIAATLIVVEKYFLAPAAADDYFVNGVVVTCWIVIVLALFISSAKSYSDCGNIWSCPVIEKCDE